MWWTAIRPRTLGMSIAPVALGTALVVARGSGLDFAVLLATLSCALLIQIGTNLYNDAVDFERGTDRPERKGPLRVTLAGWATAAEVKRGALLCLLLALALGVWLSAVGGALIFAIGLAALVAGWAYSGGPWPISHSPLGEFFVLLFFGVLAVLGDGAVAPVLDPIALLAAHADGSLRARAAAPVSRAPASRTAPLCLVVDDSVSVRRTTEIFVRDLGFEVDGAADGIEALERVRRRVPDLALVDMEMPRMNGLEFVRALRADPRSANVAVIMITSRYSERHKTLALEAGVDVFLTKPYTEDALATQILACLERRPAHAPPAAPVPGRT